METNDATKSFFVSQESSKKSENTPFKDYQKEILSKRTSSARYNLAKNSDEEDVFADAREDVESCSGDSQSNKDQLLEWVEQRAKRKAEYRKRRREWKASRNKKI